MKSAMSLINRSQYQIVITKLLRAHHDRSRDAVHGRNKIVQDFVHQNQISALDVKMTV